jgi:hypothetical protein
MKSMMIELINMQLLVIFLTTKKNKISKNIQMKKEFIQKVKSHILK